MVPNHSGDPYGPTWGQWGPIGSKNWVKNVNNYHAAKLEFFPKNGSYSYGAKSRWGHPRVHLGADGVPLGKKNGSKPLKITMPKNSNFRLPRGHRFFAKNGIYGCGVKSRLAAPRVHLGAKGVPLGTKMGQNCKKITMPQNSNFSPKMEVTVMAPNHGGDSLGCIMGQMGSHWVKKWVKSVKIHHAPKFEFSTTPLSSIFLQKMEVTVMAPNHGGDSLGSIMGQMGSHWVK